MPLSYAPASRSRSSILPTPICTPHARKTTVRLVGPQAARHSALYWSALSQPMLASHWQSLFVLAATSTVGALAPAPGVSVTLVGGVPGRLDQFAGPTA